MPSAILYRRVSTERQASEGVSLSAQRTRMRAYCQSRGWRVSGEFEDAGVSGKSMAKREGLERALTRCCERKGVLVVYALDRLTRSVKDAGVISERLQAAGAQLAIIDIGIDTTTSYGEFVYNLLASLGRMESRRIGERVKAANAETIRQKGHRTQGRQIYGFRFDPLTKTRVLDPERAEVADWMLQARETRTLVEIAALLNEAGIPSPRGMLWAAGGVGHVVKAWKLARPALSPKP